MEEQKTMKQVETTELFRTSQSWDGAELPDYPQGFRREANSAGITTMR